MREAAGQASVVAGSESALPNGSSVVNERTLLLECRMATLRSALEEARADADRLRNLVADCAAREADHARRYSLVHQELADARTEIASLHEHLHRSEALRAKLEGNLFEPDTGSDAAELVRLRREIVTQRQRAQFQEQTATRLRARVDELLMSRDTLLSRMAEWQQLLQTGDPEQVDLGEFISELRQDILVLENRDAASARQEMALRELLSRAGVDPDAPLVANGVRAEPEVIAPAPAPAPAATPVAAAEPAAAMPEPEPQEAEPELTDTQPDASTFEGFLAIPRELDAELDRLWDVEPDVPEETVEITTEPAAPEPVIAPAAEWVDTIEVATTAEIEVALEPVAAVAESAVAFELVPVPEVRDEPVPPAPIDGLSSDDPMVRAAWYGRLSRDLEDSPSRLADHLRSGLADADPRVRRRAVLAAATARNVSLRPLLDPLRSDPDPQVRRVVREVLRHAPAADPNTHDSAGMT